MRKLIVNEKTGFKNNTPNVPICIRDVRGIMFYETISFGKPVLFFNMPKGIYFVESGNFSPIPEPVKYELVTLPPKERSKEDPKNFRILKRHNPNKCSIIWDKKVIVFDKTLFDTSPAPRIHFVYGHELGHRYYKTEKFCDLYAANYMIGLGYNPSQIGTSPLRTLNRRQKERRKLTMLKMIQHNGRGTNKPR